MGLELTILVLLILGLAFMTLEAFAPSFGLLGLGGAVSFFAALWMMRNLESFYGIAVDAPLLGALGCLGVVVLIGSAWFIMVAWRQKITAGVESLLGAKAKVLEWSDNQGRVHVDGETWLAIGTKDITVGDTVKVIARDHLTLTVTKDISQ